MIPRRWFASALVLFTVGVLAVPLTAGRHKPAQLTVASGPSSTPYRIYRDLPPPTTTTTRPRPVTTTMPKRPTTTRAARTATTPRPFPERLPETTTTTNAVPERLPEIAPTSVGESKWTVPEGCMANAEKSKSEMRRCWDGLVARWSWPSVSTVFAVMYCESKGNPWARNRSGATGLMQIRDKQKDGTYGGPLDPWENMVRAWAKSNGGRNWGPWSECL